MTALSVYLAVGFLISTAMAEHGDSALDLCVGAMCWPLLLVYVLVSALGGDEASGIPSMWDGDA